MMAEALLKDQLGFQEVEVRKNLTKKAIDEEIWKLKQRALEFEQNKQGKETQVIAIISVGHSMDSFFPRDKPLYAELGLEAPPDKVGAYENIFELTYEGEPLNLNESATWIADTREVQGATFSDKFSSSTHVIVMNDFQ